MTALTARLQKGVAGLTSAHLSLSVKVAGAGLTGSGDEKLAGGKLQAMALTENLSGTTFAIVVVDKRAYVKLPAAVNRSGKPWTLVTASSSNPVVRQLSASINSSLQSASVSSASTLARSASSVTDAGPATIDGTHTTHYRVVIDTARLPADFPNRAAVQKAGVASIPIDMYVDDQGHPIRVVENFAVQGNKVSVVLALSRFNERITIAAPPASQVSSH